MVAENLPIMSLIRGPLFGPDFDEVSRQSLGFRRLASADQPSTLHCVSKLFVALPTTCSDAGRCEVFDGSLVRAGFDGVGILGAFVVADALAGLTSETAL